MRAFGKYRLIEPLATGGMAEVWRAEVTGAEGVVKEVALKLVRGEYEADSAFVRMFIQEARLAARLGHANIVQVFEFDQVDGRYYIAMELVRGRHLGQVVERARERGVRPGVPRAVHVAAEVARGLAYAHRLSVVHRDVSPHNVLVSVEGEVKLADFGIARAMNLASATAPGTIKGKAAYMAPEQARGAAAADARADVFALGVVLWELCTGRRLFARQTEATTIEAVLSPEAVTAPSAWNEDVPPELDAAVLAALEKDREKRTPSAQDLATALSSVLLRVTRSPEDADLRGFMQRLFPEDLAPRPASPEPTRVRPVAVAAEPVAEPTRPAPAEESVTRTATAGIRRRTLVPKLAIAGAVALAVAGAAIALLRGRGPADVAARTAAPAPIAAAVPAIAESAPPAPIAAAVPAAAESAPPAPIAAAVPAAAESAPLAPAPPPPPPPASSAPATRPPLAAASPTTASPGPSAPAGRQPNEYGTLKVISVPWGLVRIDGKPRGETPLDVQLPVGSHRVIVASPNPQKFGSARATVTIEAGKQSVVRLPLPAP